MSGTVQPCKPIPHQAMQEPSTYLTSEAQETAANEAETGVVKEEGVPQVVCSNFTGQLQSSTTCEPAAPPHSELEATVLRILRFWSGVAAGANFQATICTGTKQCLQRVFQLPFHSL